MPSVSDTLILIYRFAIGLDILKYSATVVIFFFSKVSQNCWTSSTSSHFFYGSPPALYIVFWKDSGFYCHIAVPDHPDSWVVYYHNAVWRDIFCQVPFPSIFCQIPDPVFFHLLCKGKKAFPL